MSNPAIKFVKSLIDGVKMALPRQKPGVKLSDDDIYELAVRYANESGESQVVVFTTGQKITVYPNKVKERELLELKFNKAYW